MNKTNGKILNKKIITILVMMLLISTIFTIMPTVKADDGNWAIETVGSAGSICHNSLDLDSNNYPHIAYCPYNNEYTLKYAKKTGTTWDTETIESTTGSTCSIDMDSNNKPHIAYRKGGSVQDLKYAKKTGSSWTTETVDSDGNVGQYSSLVLDSNNYPHIAYRDETNKDLKYAKKTSSGWTIETIDSEGNVGKDCSIDLDSNNRPHIVYTGYANADYYLKYARWTGSTWHIETVDSDGDTGWENDLVIDSNNNVHVSYFKGESDHDLRYAIRSGSSWTKTTISTNGGRATSIDVDSNNKPHISCYNSDDDLVYWEKTASSWSMELVTSDGDSCDSSIKLDSDDYPCISFHYDTSPYALKYAKKEADADTPEIQLTPTSHDYGNIAVDTCSPEQSFTLKNTGTGTATGTISLTGSNPNQYTITQGSGSFSLTAGATQTIKIKFCPTTTGSKSATLKADGSNCNDDTSSLTGVGYIADQPEIQLTPTSHDYGNIKVDTCSPEKSFTLKNTGTGTATGTISLTGSNPNQYTITQGSGSFSLTAGATQTIKIKFCPTSTGTKTATLKADGSNCNDDTSSLTGIGYISNNAPYTPSNPSPSNNANNIAIDGITLTWTGGDPNGDDVTYNLFLNVCPEPDNPLLYINGEEPVMSLTDTQYADILLSIDQYYYWKIIATDENGKQTEGPIWTFHTIPSEQCNIPDNSPPNQPLTPVLGFPNPYDFHVGDWCIFSTNVVDPDGDNINIYWDMDEDDGIDFEMLNVPSGEACSIFYVWDKPAGYHNVRVIATDLLSELSEWSEPLFVAVIAAENNNPPNSTTKPSGPSGISDYYANQPYTFTTEATDPDGDRVKYKWDFGDGTIIDWADNIWVDSGATGSYSHTWDRIGVYDVRVKVIDINGATSEWSDSKKVYIVKKNTATIFNRDDFAGGTHGDIFDNFPGQGRIIHANGPSGTIVTGAFAGFPIGHAWSTACQGIAFYVGREKEVTIDAELNYISGTDFVPPFSYTCLQKVIKIDGFHEPEKEFKEWINNIGTVDDLVAICTGAMGLIGAVKAGSVDIQELLRNYMYTQTHMEMVHHQIGSTNDFLRAFQGQSMMGEKAKLGYIHGWQHIVSSPNSVMVPGASSTGASSTAAIKATMAGEPVAAAGSLFLIITVAFQLWTLFQLMTHWNIDTLLAEYEKTGQAHTEHYSKTYTFDEGIHDVWAGIQTEAVGGALWFGFAYAAGMIKSITIDGIAPPEKPVLSYPANMLPNKEIEFRPYGIDQNDDPIRYIIDWDDGSEPTESIWYASGEEGSVSHTYDESGWYNITLKTKDCDKMESEEATYKIYIGRSSGGAKSTQYNFLSRFIDKYPILKQLLQLSIFEKILN